MSRPASSSPFGGVTPGAGWIVCAWYISGTISASPPKLIATNVSTAIRPMFFSMVEWEKLMVVAPLGCDRSGDRDRFRRARAAPGLPQVPRHDHHAAQV